MSNSSIPPNESTILYIVKQIKSEQSRVGALLSTMNSTLGGVGVSVRAIERENKEQNERLIELEREQGRIGQEVRGLNKRVSNIETDYKSDLRTRADASQSIDVAAQKAEAIAMAQRVPAAPAPEGGLTKLLSKETLLALFLAVITGAALGGFLLHKMLSDEAPAPPAAQTAKEEG